MTCQVRILFIFGLKKLKFWLYIFFKSFRKLYYQKIYGQETFENLKKNNIKLKDFIDFVVDQCTPEIREGFLSYMVNYRDVPLFLVKQYNDYKNNNNV